MEKDLNENQNRYEGRFKETNRGFHRDLKTLTLLVSLLIELIQKVRIGHLPLGMFQNLRFNYRYRDAHNYKEFGSVVFANTAGISIETATALLREKLISEEFFIPKDWGIPRLHVRPYNPEVDHEWHEFEEFEFTEERATDGRDIGEFLEGGCKGRKLKEEN